MKCPVCHNGETKSGFTTVTLEKNQTTLIFKEVPAQICENCGEEYVSSQTNEKLLSLSQEAVKHGVALEVSKYAA